ncbi:MAG: CHAT domain-containing protein [Geminicoccaceae bacterium]
MAATFTLGVCLSTLGVLLAEESKVDSAEIGRLLASGRYLDALEPLEQALTEARSTGNADVEATSLHDLGLAYLGSGKLDLAADHLNQAATLAETTGLPRLQASALDNLGTLHAARPGEDEQAAAAYRRAIDLAESEGDPPLAFNALTNMARLDLDRGRQLEARALLERASTHLAAAAGDERNIEDVLLFGRLSARAGDIEAGYGALSDSRARAREAGQPRLEALATGYLANLYASSKRDDEAVVLYDEATFLAQTAEAPELVYRWQWQVGRLLAKAGDVDRAIDRYRSSVAALDRLRPTLIEARTPASRSIDLRTPYVELADLMLKRAAGSASKDAKQRDLEEARDTIERYRSTELTDYFQDECVTDLLASVQPIDRLEPNTAVLYPIMMSDRLVILLSLAGGMQQRSLPMGAEALTRRILEFRQLLEKRTTNQFLRPAQQLYDLLLRPLEPALAAAGVDTLVIVPDEALRTVPLAALHDGEQFVVDRYALATVPSLRLLEPKPLAGFGLQPLLTGLSEPVQGFPALPYVENELATIGELIGGQVLRNQSFVADQVQQSLSATPHSVVHIASHAQFTGDAKESFILTYDGRMDMDSLERFIKQSRFRDKPVELLTLSACETAAGDDRAALGLAGLAVKSGARSAVASLWQVNDRASSLLIADFYERLRDEAGISKARALQQAQIETKADLRYRHPAYWAPLVLIGNWL